MRTIRPINFGFALFCLFLSNWIASGQAPAQNQPTQSRAEYCQASSSDGATIYFSDVFESNVPSNVIVSGGIENLFGAYLEQPYKYKSSPVTPVVCAIAQSSAASEQDKKQVQAGYTMRGKPFVETHWKLSRQQAAALAAVPLGPQCYDSNDLKTPGCEQILHPAKPAGVGSPSTPSASAAANPNAILYELCRAVTSVMTGGKRTTYFSDIMPRANINDADYSAAFAAFLAKKYGPQYVTPECGASRSQAEARNWMEEGWWKVNPNFSTAVQTGWIYLPASTPTSPAPAPAASSTPITSYTVCVASDAPIAYVSAAFPVTSMNNPAWTNGFTQFLAQNYSYKGRVGCNNMDAEHAPTFLKNRIAGLRANKKQVVETGWTYGSPATAPAATASPVRPVQADQAPPTQPPATTAHNIGQHGAAGGEEALPNLYGICQAISDPHTAYFSAPFLVHNGNSSNWEQAFAQFLQTKYKYSANVGCIRSGSLADAQAYLKQLDDAMRPTKKIVDTGWEYKQ
jgi:hypothetical protein